LGKNQKVQVPMVPKADQSKGQGMSGAELSTPARRQEEEIAPALEHSDDLPEE